MALELKQTQLTVFWCVIPNAKLVPSDAGS